MREVVARILIVGAVVLAAVVVIHRLTAQQSPRAADAPVVEAAAGRITIDYPADGSIFPPEITTPTFLWRDAAQAAAVWRIDVAFADGSAGIQAASHGERLRIGEIDPRCIADTNKLPELTPQQAAARTWAPDAGTWAAIKKHSTAGAATVTITGYRSQDPDHAVSRGRVTIQTSKDPVGAPIFYRDVPLMPAETEKGVIKPIASQAVPLISWRLRSVGEPHSRLLMGNLPTCANCHSFSLDGGTLGMDLDGPQNNKGMYTLVAITPEMSIRNENVIEWSSVRGKLEGKLRIGFMSQVSPDGQPDGQYVVTRINGSDADREPSASSPEARRRKLLNDPSNNDYVANFTDYRFLQVFYPTRGILAWYSRATGRLQPLPGADDPRYVQTSAFGSPDGKYLAFARAEAKDAYPENAPLARFANDPNETEIHSTSTGFPSTEAEVAGRNLLPAPRGTA